MKHKIIRIVGVLLFVLGVVIITLVFLSREKPVIGSIAAGATPISMGSILLGVSRMLERKKASRDPSDTPK